MITTTNLLIALLVPLFVAFVLFKFLNSSATVKGKMITSGPFKDIQFDLGGAFAAYVIGAAGILYFFSWQAKNADDQVWIVKGAVKFANKNSTLSPVNVSLGFEPSQKVLDDGSFDISIVRNYREVFPKVKIFHDGFSPRIVHIENDPRLKYKVQFDEDKRTISIQDTIVLEPIN